MNIHCICLLIALTTVVKDAIAQNTPSKNQQKVASKYKYKENDNFRIPLKVSQSETLLMPIRGLLPAQYSKQTTTPLITKISQIKNDRTNRNSQSVCNVIRAPVHKPFRIKHKLNHKIQSQSEWQKLAINKQVVYRLEDISKLDYALDMEIIHDKIVLIFEDGQIIFYQLASENLKQVARKSVFQQKNVNKKNALRQGKLISMRQFGIYVSSSQLIFINGKDLSIKVAQNYQYTPYFYTAILTKNGKQNNLIVASGKRGMKYYTIDFQRKQINKIGQHLLTFEQKNLPGQILNVSVVDLIEVTTLLKKVSNVSTYLILDPNHGLLNVEITQGQNLGTVKAVRTSMKYKNCRLMTIHSSEVYTSCPQVIRYNPITDQIDVKSILTQLPLEIISTPSHLTLISHTSFQVFDHCSGAIEQGRMDGHSFQHTIPYGGFYVSIDDISIVLWTIKYAEYFLACKGNKMFQGTNNFDLYVTSVCENSQQCCIETFKAYLQIYDSSDGLHMFEIVGAVFIGIISLILALWILFKKRGLREQYNQLMQEPQMKNEQTQNTEQSINEGAPKKNQNVEHVEIVE